MSEPGATKARLVPDIFVIQSDTDGRFIVYAPLIRTAFETNARGVRLLRAIAEEAVAEPALGRIAEFFHFLRRADIIDPARVADPTSAHGGEFAPTSVTLFLTTNCNLRCTYCYAAAGETPSRTMKWPVAQAALDLVQENALRTGAQEIELMFHGGGEPTLAWPLLLRSVAHMDCFCRAEGRSLAVSLSTNGVLSDEQIEFVAARCTSVNVSFDGREVIQDRQRPMVRGGPSFPAVVHTLTRFDETGVRYGLRLTVTERSLPTVGETVEWLADRFRPLVVHLEPSFLMGRCTQASEPPPGAREFADAFDTCRRKAAARGVTVHYSGLNADLLTSHFCGLSQDAFAVTTEGVVSSCYECFLEEDPRGRTFFYGRLDPASGRFRFDSERIAALRRMNVTHKAFCRDCFVKWHCAGDCHHRALAGASEADAFQGSPRCWLNQELTRRVVIERVRAGGGVWKEASS